MAPPVKPNPTGTLAPQLWASSSGSVVPSCFFLYTEQEMGRSVPPELPGVLCLRNNVGVKFEAAALETLLPSGRSSTLGWFS